MKNKLYQWLSNIFYLLHLYFLPPKELSSKEIIENPSISPRTTSEEISISEFPLEQRETGDYSRKLLVLLSKDTLTDAEIKELDALTSGQEVIILEDT